MQRIHLAIARFFVPVLQSLGVDGRAFLVILEHKLIMDGRRTYVQWGMKQEDGRNRLHLILGIYFVLGLFLGLMILIFDQFLLASMFFFGFLMFLITMTLITDFSSVLLDTADHQVLLSRPVSARTVFAARGMHICLYLYTFTMAISAGSWICTFVRHGFLAGFAIILLSFLAVLFCVFLTFILYMLILRYGSEERIQHLVTWLQVFMTVIFMAGYQLVPRLLSTVLRNVAIRNIPWVKYFPPAWFALTLEAIRSGNWGRMQLFMVGLSCILPLVITWFLFRYLAPGFADQLERLKSGEGRMKKKSITQAGTELWIVSFFARLFCSNRLERASFLFAWKALGRERYFRLQLIPLFVYVIFMAFFFMLDMGKDFSTRWAELPGTRAYLWMAYAPILVILGGVSILFYHEQYEAAWIFRASPILKPAMLTRGAVKVITVRYYLPILILNYAFSVYVWGWRVSLDFLLGINLAIFVHALAIYLDREALVFTRNPGAQDVSTNFLRGLVVMLLLGLVVAAHYFLSVYPFALAGIQVMILAGTLFLDARNRAVGWEDMEQE